MNRHMEIKAKGDPEWTSLFDHLMHVKLAIEKIAFHTGFDVEKAAIGAIFHDIGKTHPVFQARLKGEKSTQTFRHEITSLMFLPLIKQEWQEDVVEMIIAHHKSIRNDFKFKGILDLEEREPQVFEYHSGNWNEWAPIALEILESFEITTRPVTFEEAKASYDYVLDFCEHKIRKEKGFSIWRGLLMGADHFASAMIDKTEEKLINIFREPNLSFFNRQHPLYPLSYYPTNSNKPHTLVVASTGAGKTDFLFRRCSERVFYTLPFQASINAMFSRLQRDLKKDNPELDIRVLHGASSLIEKEDGDKEDIVLQRHIGSAIKVLTPYQLIGIALGSKGYESIILDVAGCDVVLDEVHTYSSISQALVLKLISVLKTLGCRIHVGTATMPSILYNKIKEILGEEKVLETKLSEEEIDQYDRHEIFKISSWEESNEIIKNAIVADQKILIVCNRVKTAQTVYQEIKNTYPNIDCLLLHSRMKRKDRREREIELMGMTEEGVPTGKFNTGQNSCIVVSTQVVEVSLDISFDLMITECAPMDAMIQRFGRINRKRSAETIGKTKPIFVLPPPEDEKKAKPYDLSILEKSYANLPDGKVLHERELQDKIDNVFTAIDFLKIEEAAVFTEDERWVIPPLTNGTAWLVEMLEIDSVVCIVESDYLAYRNGTYKEKMELEIPVRYWAVKNFHRLEFGNGPYMIPEEAYHSDLGLIQESLKTTSVKTQIS